MKKKIILLILTCSVFLTGCLNRNSDENPIDDEIQLANYVTPDYDEEYDEEVDKDLDKEKEDEVVEPEPEMVNALIQLVGDILLHPRYTGSVETARTGPDTFNFHPFLEHIAPYIVGDLAIANMETPVDVMGGNQDLSTFPFFNVPFEILPALVDTGFNHLVTANNHSFDRGFGGLVATVDNIAKAGLTQTGMYVDRAAFDELTIKDVNGIKVGIIAYTDSVNGLESFVTDDQREFAVRRFRSHVLDDVERMAVNISRLRDAGAEFVILSVHWGAEYVDEPTQMQRLVARALVDAGADVIMGNHAHVVQPVEWHEREDGSRGFIIYSLGNFLADQTRLTAPSIDAQINSGHGRTQYGKIVNINIERDNSGTVSIVDANIIPTLTMRDYGGNTLRFVDDVTVLPIFDAELPDFVSYEPTRNWGRVAYEHVTRIVGREFILGRENE